MRRSVASGIGAGLLYLSFGAPMNVGAHSSSDKLVCSRSSNGGVLVRGVCILPAASVGQPYEGFILTSTSSGGTFSIVSGTVPPGMTMPASYGAAGTIVAGTPTASGRFPFTVRGSDDQGQPLRQAYSIRVGGPLPLRDTTITPLPPGDAGSTYAANFFLSAGAPRYTWSLLSGTLPPGLKLVSTDSPADNGNQLAGTPTSAGTFQFSMQVTDTAGQSASGRVEVTIAP
jgi:hypothetical protein